MVRMRYWELGVGWVGGWVGGLGTWRLVSL